MIADWGLSIADCLPHSAFTIPHSPADLCTYALFALALGVFVFGSVRFGESARRVSVTVSCRCGAAGRITLYVVDPADAHRYRDMLTAECPRCRAKHCRVGTAHLVGRALPADQGRRVGTAHLVRRALPADQHRDRKEAVLFQHSPFTIHHSSGASHVL